MNFSVSNTKKKKDQDSQAALLDRLERAQYEFEMRASGSMPCEEEGVNPGQCGLGVAHHPFSFEKALHQGS